MKLILHLDQGERETDGAVHWKSLCPKLHAFQKEMDTPTLILNSLNLSGSEAMKLDFSVEKFPGRSIVRSRNSGTNWRGRDRA